MAGYGALQFKNDPVSIPSQVGILLVVRMRRGSKLGTTPVSIPSQVGILLVVMVATRLTRVG